MSFVITYLIAMCVVSVVNACILQVFYSKQHNVYFSAVFYAIVVANFGHLLLALSCSLEGVLIANKVCYLGACFLPMFLLFAILRLCKVAFPVWAKGLLVLFCIVVFGLSLTVGYSDIYYASVQYVSENGIGNYIPVFGPAHILWNILLLGFVLSDIAVIAYAALKRNNVSYKNLIALTAIQAVTIASFIVARQMENDMLLMPLVYVIDEVILLIIFIRVKKYDIVSCISNAVEKGNEIGFVAFSANHLFLGCNRIALRYFPELDNFRVDHLIDTESKLGSIFGNWLDSFDKGEHFRTYTFEYGTRCYKAFQRNMTDSKFSKILLFQIEDDTKLQRYIKALDTSNDKLERAIKNNASHIQAIQEQMIVSMSKMVESRDSSTGGHIKRTSKVINILTDAIRNGDEFLYSDEFYRALVSAAPMHDVGKIAVDDQILRKKGRFTQDEFDVMKKHAEQGAAIVENLLTPIEEPYFVEIAKNVANYHHERWDGSGYPQGLSGVAIPFEARVMAVADVYDALVSKRCYKERMSFEEANEIILDSMGTHFDPSLKKYYLSCRDKLEEYYTSVEAG